ncbi:tetratricopeptide repeat protein [Microcoleus sp. PH2017_30_WIL_O_A]|uniref:tetratricopeptide repeat protein n=1 Tax=Microcoleus sp. PH2017_30_WIL_O_A TaxID=2798840 RepID=UPI001D2D30C6|nr:tetratricopeptide repeat protein [Microcoleus sp. PH2017_30_WIL_O_A]MCC3584924.1 tetratricopeptide repeat protein [Microcoleus sp. PH2017_30_WIL_O_A]
MSTNKTAAIYLTNGNKFLEEGNLEEAITAFRSAIELNPHYSWSHHNLGEALAKLGKLEEAIIAFRRAIELNPDFSWSYHHLGDVLERQQQWGEAVVAFGKAIELNPDHFGSYCGLGQNLVKLGRLDEAISAYRRASELEPEADWIHYRLGDVLQQRTKMNLEEAITSYRRAIELNPDDVQACGKLLEIHPNNLEVLLQLGKALVKQEQWKEASIYYRKAIELNSKDASVHYQLGAVLEKQDNLEEAISYYRKAIELDPCFMSDDSSFAKAVAKLRQIEKFPPHIADFLMQTSDLRDADFVQETFRTYLRRSLGDEGIAEYLEMTRSMTREQIICGISNSQEFRFRWPFSFALTSLNIVHWSIGSFFAQNSLWEEAIAAYYKAIILKPEIAIAYSRLTENFGMQNKLDEESALRSRFFKLIAAYPDSSELYTCIGKFLTIRGRFGEAIKMYQKAISLQPDSSKCGEIYSEMGQALFSSNQLDKALDSFKKALETNFANKETYMAIGHIYAYSNQVNLAISFFHKALIIDPENSEYYIHLGHSYGRINNLDLAISCYKNAIQNPPVHHHAYTSLANILIAENKQEEAHLIINNLISLNLPLSYTEKQGIVKLMEKVGWSEEQNTYIEKLKLHPPIKEICDSVKNSVANFSIKITNYIEIHPPHVVEFPNPPKTIHKDLDPRVAFPDKFESPKTFVVILPNGRYCAWGTTTAVITSDNKLLSELTTEFQDPHHIPAYHIEGTVAALSANTGNNYYHWLYDMLPRYGLLELSGIDIDSIDRFLVSGYFLNAQKETLKSLGIPSHKVIDSLTYPHIEADKLVVPSYAGIVNSPTKWIVNFLRDKFLPLADNSKSENPERIYLTRRSARSRKIINEDEVFNLLQEYGFTTIDPANLSIAELAPLMANAKVVIGYGAGNANLFLCSPGTKVIELFSPYFIGPNYRMICHHLGLDYYYLLGSEGIVCSYLRKLIYPGDGWVDNLVSLDALKQLFKLARVEPRRREL